MKITSLLANLGIGHENYDGDYFPPSISIPAQLRRLTSRKLIILAGLAMVAVGVVCLYLSGGVARKHVTQSTERTLEEQFADNLLAHYLAGGSEAQAQVEPFRAAVTLHPQDGDALQTTPPRFCRDRLYRESAVPPALLIGCDVQPPDTCPERIDLALRVEAAHDEPDDAIVVQDEPWPGRGVMDVGLGDGVDDRGNEFPLLGLDLNAARCLNVVRRQFRQPQRHGRHGSKAYRCIPRMAHCSSAAITLVRVVGSARSRVASEPLPFVVQLHDPLYLLNRQVHYPRNILVLGLQLTGDSADRLAQCSTCTL